MSGEPDNDVSDKPNSGVSGITESGVPGKPDSGVSGKPDSGVSGKPDRDVSDKSDQLGDKQVPDGCSKDVHGDEQDVCIELHKINIKLKYPQYL